MSKKTSTKKRTHGSLHPIVGGRGYAWLCDFGLCHWVEPDRKRLVSKNPPSPEACAVPVRIITEKDYRKLINR